MTTQPCETETMLITDSRPLTALDRCDRCGAQGYVRLSRGTVELLFCAHHDHEYGAKAREWADSIRDETADLTAKS